MAEIRRRVPSAHFLVYTTVPAWFFVDELGESGTVREILADVGFSQSDPFAVDLADTVRRLGRLLPYDPALIKELAAEVADCRFVLSDIAPLGILVAERAGIESVLLENFTWDFLYQHYLDREPRLAPFCRLFRDMFGRATVRIQTEPLCVASARADFVARPISRSSTLTANEVRTRLGLPADGRRVVLASFGGICGEVLDRELLVKKAPEEIFLVAGPYDAMRWHGNVLLLPYRSGFGHADLMTVADAVLLKAGYSTLAEAYHAGVPIGYVLRDDFPESPGLELFIVREMPGVKVPQEDLASGVWLGCLSALYALGRREPKEANGRVQVAEYLCRRYALGPAAGL